MNCIRFIVFNVVLLFQGDAQLVNKDTVPNEIDDQPDATTIKPPEYYVRGPSTSKVCPALPNNLDHLTQDHFIDKITDSCRYDKLIKPPSTGPLLVSMQMDLSHIDSIEQLQFRMHMLVQYLYRDIRLAFNKTSPQRNSLLGEESLRDKIWVPHIMIGNEKDTSIMGLDGRDVFVSISPQGDVVYSYRLIVTFYCWMNLQKFPFDTQQCNLQFTSWTYNSSNLLLVWDEVQPVKLAENLHLTEFIMNDYWSETDVLPAPFNKGAFVGNFSQLIFKFKLTREVGFYILDYFLPSILLVITSWVTFWLQADAAPPRVVLGTATMLSFITLNGGLTKSLPKVSYIKASEIWFLGCSIFIFCSLAEFAFVNVIWRRRKQVELKKQTSKYILKSAISPHLARKELRKAESNVSIYKVRSLSSLNTENDEKDYKSSNYLTVHSFPSNTNIPIITTQSNEQLVDNCPSTPENGPAPITWATMTPHEVAIWIDNKSRIVFPVSFLIFNIFYWTFVYVL